MSDLPALRHKLPNPPPGAYRAPEVLAALRARLDAARGALTIVHGEPGAGRSCALMMALETREQRPIYIALEACSQDDVLRKLCRVLVVDAKVHQEHQDLRMALLDVLEQCEHLELCVVVDAPWQTASLHLLADCVMRYARQSRWILVMDTLPWRAHALDVIEVPAPTRAEKSTWLEHLAPSWSQARRGALLDAHAAQGFAELERAIAQRCSPMATISEELLDLCAELQALSAPSQASWARHETLSGALRVLESRGAVRRQAAGHWQLTRDAQEALSARSLLARSSSHRPLTRALQAMPRDPLVAFALFELAMQRADDEAALAQLQAHFEQWSARGWLSIVWGHLERAGQWPLAFEHYRMRCALITLDSSHLEVLCEPLDPGAPAQLLWMSVLAERGQLQEARRIFAQHGGALGEVTAQLYDASLCMGEGEFELAITRCTQIDRTGLTRDEAFFLDGISVLALTWAHRREEAMERANQLRAQLGVHAQSHPLQRHAWVNMARALHLCGALDLARDALARSRALPIRHDDPFLSFHSQASVDYLEALIHVQALELEEAERLLEPLSIRYQPAHRLGFHVHQLLVAVSMCRDDYEGVISRVAHIQHLSPQAHEPWNVLQIYHAGAIAGKLGFAHTTALTTLEHASFHGIQFDLERALRLEGLTGLHVLRARHDPDVIAQLWSAGEWIASLEELFTSPDRYDVVASALMAQHSKAERHQNIKRQIAIERRHAICALHGGRDEASELWHRVATSARRHGNEVWRLAGEFVVALHQPGGLTVSAWLSWHQRLPASMMKRVCAGILGAPLPDLVERRCAQALEARLRWSITRAPGVTEEPVLWLDLHESTLHSHEGRVSVPSRGAQRSLLEVLCACPGQVLSKQQLLEQVWSIQEFHPLRHENRLRMAIFKLRKLLAQLTDISAPEDTFIVTCEDGYALAPGVFVVKYD